MFRIGSQPPPQPAASIGPTSAQGGSGTSNQLSAAMAALDQAIAALGGKFGSSPGGGDSMESPLGNASVPKSGLAGASVGTEKSAHVHHGAHAHHHHGVHAHHRPAPDQSPVATPLPVGVKVPQATTQLPTAGGGAGPVADSTYLAEKNGGGMAGGVIGT